MISERDEAPHEPTDHLRWQENCYILGGDDRTQSGMLLHVERFPNHDTVDVRVVAVAGGHIASAAVIAPIDDAVDFGLPGCRAEVVDPFRRVDVVVDVPATQGRGPAGLLALNGGDVPLKLDIALEADLPPIDWAEALAAFPVAGTERDHYEVAHRWAGTITVGDTTVEARGLAVRDHTWGPREHDRFPRAWWFPACLDDARAYVTGAAVEVDGAWHGIGIVADDHGVAAATTVEVTVDGPAHIAGYAGATVRFEPAGRPPLEIVTTTRLHLPVHYPGFGSARYCNEAMSTVRCGERTGFSSIELNADLDASTLDQAAAVAQTG